MNKLNKSTKEVKEVKTNNLKEANMKEVKEAKEVKVLTIDEQINLSTEHVKHLNFGFLFDIPKKDFDSCTLEQKTKIFAIHHAYNKYNNTTIENRKLQIKDLRDSIKLQNELLKYDKLDGKNLSDKFGKIEKLSKQDFVLYCYIKGNNPKNIINKSMLIWDFSAKATWTTINAFGGSNDTNKKFEELKEEYSMDVIGQSNGMKVYKINFDNLTKEQSLKLTKLQNLSISDFEHEASIQKSRLDSIKLETSENLEVLDDSIPTIEIDF